MEPFRKRNHCAARNRITDHGDRRRSRQPLALHRNPGAWQALKTHDGWRVVRLNAVTTAKPAVFEVLRGVVLHDWTDATAAEQRTAAVRALARRYKIKHELPVGDSGE